MATTDVVPVSESSSSDSSAHITTTLTTYRSYGGFDENGKARNVKKSKVKNADGTETETLSYEGLPSVLSETQTKKNWDEAEKRGATVLNENAYKFHTLVSLDGFETLVSSPEQRLYIIQKGIDALETAAANSYQGEFNEKNSKDDPDVYTYNGETIDLLEALNTPPKRQKLSDEDRFMRAAGALPKDKLKAMLAKYAAELMAQAE